MKLSITINEETDNLNISNCNSKASNSNSNECGQTLDKNYNTQNLKPHIPIEKVLSKMKKKENVLETIEIQNIQEKTVLNFEIFLSKWERNVMLENQYIDLENILEIIKSNLIKMSKRELNINNISSKDFNIHSVGSYKNMTMRSNYLVIDLIVEYSNNLNKDGVFDKSFNCLNDINELREKEYKFTKCISEDLNDNKV